MAGRHRRLHAGVAHLDAGQVLFKMRADERGGKRVFALEGTQFIGRFMLHVLPAGFKRIRHYGLLAPAAKVQRLAAARHLLAMPQPGPVRQDDARAFMRRVAAIEIETCSHCGRGRWQVIDVVAAARSWLSGPADRAVVEAPAQAAQGPP
ncbi:MAG: transposase [Rubrivivax sp.]